MFTFECLPAATTEIVEVIVSLLQEQ